MGPKIRSVRNVAGGAVARASGGWTVPVVVRRAVCLSVGFARLLHGTLDAQPLHVLVGRNFGIDVAALENQGQRHSDDEQGDSRYREQQDDEPRGHGRILG